MPRDGLSQYAPPPGTNGITNYTIESTKYNGFVADVTQDLNLPRPIVAGGTGANNARDAMTSLQGDVAYQVVTNYDAYAFVSGSFYSAAGATSAPTANAFIGQCYTSDPAVVPPAVPVGQNMFVEARDATTGLKYLRQKTAGVWGAWAQQAPPSASLDAAYVNVTGDTMTGALAITGAGGSLGVTSTDTRGGGASVAMAANFNGLGLPGIYTVGSFPLLFGTNTAPGMSLNATGNGLSVGLGGTTGTYYFGNTGTKSLSYDGTNYTLAGGGFYTLGVKANGDVTAGAGTTTGTYYFGNSGTKSLSYDGTNFNVLGGHLHITGSASLLSDGQVFTGYSGTTGYFQFGSSGTKYLQYDGSNFNLVGGALFAGDLFAARTATTGYHQFGTSGTKYLAYDGLNFNHVGGPTIMGNNSGYFPNNALAVMVAATGGGTQYGVGIGVQNDNTSLMTFSNSGRVQVGSITESISAVAFNTSSSGELKEDLKSFDAGNIIDQTNVYDFAWKKTGERSYGVIAQQAVEVYPMAVTHSVPDVGDEFWGVDYSKYVPVLLQELKALRARVAELEGRVGAGTQPGRA